MDDIQFTTDGTVNFEVLDAEMRAAFGDRISGISQSGGLLTVHVLEQAEDDKALAEDVLARHDPDALTPEQAALDKAVSAPARAAAIPRWATWDEAQAAAWIAANVKDMDSARAALIDMARLLVALRDATWPGLALTDRDEMQRE